MSAPPTPTTRRHVRPHQWGMTLLELLVVIALMSVVGFMALSQVGDDLSQARYQDTENRLIALRRAIVGHEEPVFNGQRLFSGYAADNGLIPTTGAGLSVLITQPTGFDDYDATSPFFDPEPDVSGYNNGTDGGHLDGWLLFKGWRGPYLVTRPGEKDIDPDDPKPAYRDGWGNQGANVVADALDFGWSTSVPSVNGITITSRGRDGLDNSATGIDEETPYDEEMDTSVVADDWTVDVENWEVTLQNNTGTDIALAANRCLRVSLIVYRNRTASETKGRWLRLTSDCVDPPTGYLFSTTGSCLADDGDVTIWNGTAQVSEPCSNSTVVKLTAGDYATGTPTSSIPQGRHMLVLVVDEQVDDSEQYKHDSLTGADQTCESGIISDANWPRDECPGAITAKQVDFFSRAARPNVTLEIAP